MDAEPNSQVAHLSAALGSGAGIRVIETRMSWVLLTKDHVFKLKKPVRNEWVDLRSVEARRQNACQELALNQRLAADVYVGVRALVRQGGQMCLMAPGEEVPAGVAVLDWVVQMRRLPSARALSSLLRHGALSLADMAPLAELLVAFYRHAERATLQPQAHHQHLLAEAHRNEEGLARFGIQHPEALRLAAVHAEWLCQAREAIMQRVVAGRVVEGHGDLRPEHIFLLPEARVIDALEFSHRLRLVDPLDELAGLDIECIALECSWIGPWMVERYVHACDDRASLALYPLYAMGRALLRARQSAAHLILPSCQQPDAWEARTHRYLGIASRVYSAGSGVPGAVGACDGVRQQRGA